MIHRGDDVSIQIYYICYLEHLKGVINVSLFVTINVGGLDELLESMRCLLKEV